MQIIFKYFLESRKQQKKLALILQFKSNDPIFIGLKVSMIPWGYVTQTDDEMQDFSRLIVLSKVSHTST